MMQTRYLTSCSIGGLHKLAYTEWGDKDNPNVIVCAHGLSRNRHDFDVLADRLSSKHRLICFDFPGRGESDWLIDKNAYDFTQYIVDALIVIAHTNENKVDWLGTSMGGIVGMLLASMDKSPIKRLILNDVGPFIPKAALMRIAQYLGKQPNFDTVEGLEAYIRTVHAGFGNLSDKQWQHLALYGQRTLENGQLTLNYDPDISLIYSSKPLQDVNLWPIWTAIKQPTLLIHGEESDLLDGVTAEKMSQTGPQADLISIAKTGHAPALMNDADISSIQQWLNKTS
ncbi:MAG: pimeloyl-ACP methyl ester carboxylesterase [Cycloclasticus sp.]|jgi:pimeloyl-ACP methyl ester carboxylesterase